MGYGENGCRRRPVLHYDSRPGPHAAATTLTIQDPTPPEGPEQTFESMGAKFALDMEGYEAEGDVEMLLEMMTPDSTPVAPAPVAHHCTCPPNELRMPCSLSTSFQVLSTNLQYQRHWY